MFWLVFRVLSGRGKYRQVVFAGAEFLRFPGVGESLGVQLGVAEHFTKPGIVVWAVHGGVNIVEGGGVVTGSGRGIFFRCWGRGACRGSHG